MTVRCLRAAGWSEDRRVDPAPAVAALRADGYVGAAEAVARVGTFLGLHVEFPSSTDPAAVDNAHFDPVSSTEGIFVETVQEWASRVGRPLCPIGEVYGRYMTMTVDDRGHVFAGLDDTLVFLGESVAESIERICTHAELPEVP